MVYLIHFSRKHKHAQHYIGYTADEGLTVRIDAHRNGSGSKLLRHIGLKEGIEFSVVMVWPGMDRAWERKLKNQKRAPKLCPVCNPRSEASKKYHPKPGLQDQGCLYQEGSVLPSDGI